MKTLLLVINMKDSIQKLREIIFADVCSEIKSKYSSCTRKVNACLAEGKKSINEIKPIPNTSPIQFSEWTWTFKECDAEICAEAYSQKVPSAGQNSGNTGNQNGGFDRGRTGGAAAPTLAVPGDRDRSKDVNYNLKKHKEEKLCAIEKQNLDMLMSIEIAQQQELFNKGCAPYIKPSSGNSTQDTAREKARKASLDQAITKIKANYTSKLGKLNKSRECTPGD
jgi:hypothetical protein